MAKLAENQVAVDAELADAILRGTAAHGQEGNDGPVGPVVPWCCCPFTDQKPPTLVLSEGLWAARAGAGQHGTSGPGVLAQHSKIRSAVSTWQLAMLT